MLTWLSKLFTGVVSNYLGKFLSSALKFLTDLIAIKQKEKSNNADAKSVDEISKEIKDLIKSGKPVPKELKDALRIASRNLINSVNID